MRMRTRGLALGLILALLLSAFGALAEVLEFEEEILGGAPEQEVAEAEILLGEEEVPAAADAFDVFEGGDQTVEAAVSHNTMAADAPGSFEYGDRAAEAVASSNSMEAASPISVNGSYSGSIVERSQGNYYRLELPSSGRLTISSTAGIESLRYVVQNANGDKLYDTLKYWDTAAKQIALTFYLDLTQGVYYFSVQESWSKFGSYKFTVSFESAGETFGETGTGTDNSMEDANDIALGKSYTGHLGINDSIDFYRFFLPTAGRVTISARTRTKKTYYYLYDASGKQLWYDGASPKNGSTESEMTVNFNLLAGYYYLSAVRYNSNSGTYTFNLSFATANESFLDDGKDDVLEGANQINLETVYIGQLAINEERDFYAFKLKKADEVTFNISAYCDYLNFSIYDKNGVELGKKQLSCDSTTKRITYESPVALSAGSYYVCISKSYSRTGNYSLLIKGTVVPEKVVLNKKNTVSLKMGKTLQLKATVSPSTAKTTLAWSSTNPKVAKVNKNGKVTPVKAGTTTISVVTDNGKIATVKVKVVNVAPKKVKITKGTAANLKVGKKLTLKTSLTPSYAVTKLTWSSSNKKVATVSKKGVVTAKKAGTAKITVKTSNGKKAAITITVKEK